MTDDPHPGKPASRTRYIHGRCRCEGCTAENTAYQRRLLSVLAERTAAGDARVPHGSWGGYCNWLCRCEPCSAVARKVNADARARRKALVSSTLASECGAPPAPIAVEAGNEGH